MPSKKKKTPAQKKQAAKQAALRKKKAQEQQSQQAARAVSKPNLTQAPSNPLWEELQAKESQLTGLHATLLQFETDNGVAGMGVKKRKKQLSSAGQFEKYNAFQKQIKAIEAELRVLQERYDSQRALGLSKFDEAIKTLTINPRQRNRQRARNRLQQPVNPDMFAEMGCVSNHLSGARAAASDLANALKILGIADLKTDSASTSVHAEPRVAVVSAGPNVFNERRSAEQVLLSDGSSNSTSAEAAPPR